MAMFTSNTNRSYWSTLNKTIYHHNSPSTEFNLNYMTTDELLLRVRLEQDLLSSKTWSRGQGTALFIICYMHNTITAIR